MNDIVKKVGEQIPLAKERPLALILEKKRLERACGQHIPNRCMSVF